MTSEQESEARFSLRGVPDWAKITITVILTSGILISYGKVWGAGESEVRRLDAANIRLDRAETDNVLLRTENTRQTEQLLAMERRIAELERGREANRENIARIDAHMAVIDSQHQALEHGLAEIGVNLKEHMQRTDPHKSGGP